MKRLENFLTCPEYGPDRPGFAGVISERLFIRTHAKYVAFWRIFQHRQLLSFIIANG